MMSTTCSQGNASGWTSQAGSTSVAADPLEVPVSPSPPPTDNPTHTSHLRHTTQARRPRRHHRAFTLIETALAIVIIGTGVISILTAQAAFHQQNAWSTHTSTATFLANEIREMCTRLPLFDPVTGTTNWGPEANEPTLVDFDDLDDFDGANGAGVLFTAEDGSGPVNALREVIPGMDGWSQTILVYNVDPADISAEGNSNMDGTTTMARIEVTVSYQGVNDDEPVPVTTMAWVTGSSQ